MAQHDDRPDERVVKKQREWEKADARQLDEAISAMLQHEQTRRYLYWLLEITRAIGQNPMSENALRTAFNCGEQNIGQQVMAHLLECAPDGFLQLLKERSDERNSRANELDEIRGGMERAE